MRTPLVAWWKPQAPKGARRKHALAVVDYALANGFLDKSGHQERRQAVFRAGYQDLPAIVADLPAPRWDTVPVTTPVDDLQRGFAVTLLDIATQYKSPTGDEHRWRVFFAKKARTAADLLVLFVDIEPHLRHRRNDPAMLAGLDRFAFVAEVYRARARGSISRAEFDGFIDRVTSVENLDILREELACRIVAAEEPPHPGLHRTTSRPKPAPTPAPAEPVVAEPVAAELVVAESEVFEPEVTEVVVAEAEVVKPPAVDLDRARIAKYLEQALFDERLDQGEYAARVIAMLSVSTTRELARLVVDLPLPEDEPLRDRKPNSHTDDLITPSHRGTALDRLDRAMAGGVLSLWEYEIRLDVAVRARTFDELAPATADLPPGW